MCDLRQNANRTIHSFTVMCLWSVGNLETVLNMELKKDCKIILEVKCYCCAETGKACLINRCSLSHSVFFKWLFDHVNWHQDTVFYVYNNNSIFIIITVICFDLYSLTTTAINSILSNEDFCYYYFESNFFTFISFCFMHNFIN